MVNGIESTTSVSTRLSEIMHHEPAPSLDQLVVLQENGDPNLPAEYYSDCADLWELSTGQRTLPQDKSQRLFILGIRETRISGRMRLMSLVPTASMVAGSLTKLMVSTQPLHLLSAGKVEFKNEPDHPVKSRVLPSIPLDEESDLLMNDEEVIKNAESAKEKILMTTASVLFGLAAGITSKSMLLPSTAVATATPVAAHPRGNYVPVDKDEHSYWPVYVTIFIPVFVAICAEKFITKFVNVVQNMATDILVPKEEGRAVHEEGEEALPVEPMGLEDETFTWTKDMAVAFYQRTKAQHEDYINMTEKVIKENDQRIRGLEHAEAISQDKIKTTGEYADMRATRRDAQKQLEKEMKQKLEAANSDKEAAEADKEEAQQSYDDMAAVYNVAISEKKILESQLNIMTKDRDHHSKEAVQTKTKLEAEFQAYKKTRKEMLEHKEKYEHLVDQEASSDTISVAIDSN